MALMQALYSVAELEELKLAWVAKHKYSPYAASQVAAQAADAILQQQLPQLTSVTVLCGAGNIAITALLLAVALQQRALQVQVVLVDTSIQSQPLAQQALQQLQDLSIKIKPFADDLLVESELLVDALLDIDLCGVLPKKYTEAVSWLSASDIPIASLDAPSGLNVDTGMVAGSAVKADITISYFAVKRGFYTGVGKSYVGQVIEALSNTAAINTENTEGTKKTEKIEKTNGAYAPISHVYKMDSAPVSLAARDSHAHKGEFGQVLVVGGDYGMGGAVRMAAEAALRSGAGRVTVATRPEHVAVVSANRPEIMCQQIKEAQAIDNMLAVASVLVLGPGLGQCEWSEALYERLLANSLPKVLDADALNLLAKNPQQSNNWILTPHAGEAARLLGVQPSDIQADRFAAVSELVSKYSGVIVLKGSGTLIMADTDSCIQLCPYGNPGMATAGMGDMLSGVIGALLAQGLSLLQAAQMGVFVHAKAGDAAASARGERGLLATDLLEYLGKYVNQQPVVMGGR